MLGGRVWAVILRDFYFQIEDWFFAQHEVVGLPLTGVPLTVLYVLLFRFVSFGHSCIS